MIRHDVKQGSPEWIALRLGVVTGSGFNHILTPDKRQIAKGDAYLARLVAEVVLGGPIDATESEWMTRGTGLEAEAREHYGFMRGVKPDEVGFLTRDDGRVGCSPDALVGEDGGLELKCPRADTHVGYLLNPPSLAKAYFGQIQAGIYITGRKYWDIMSFNPKLSEVIVRVEPDVAYLAAIVPALDAFLARLDAALATVRPAANPFA